MNETYVWMLLGGLAVLVAVISLIASGGLRRYAGQTVSAVYRAALVVANRYDDKALEWLRSEAGVAYRKDLVVKAYAVLPSTLGGIPWKLWVTEARFCGLVEAAFEDMIDLAEDLLEPDEAQA